LAGNCYCIICRFGGPCTYPIDQSKQFVSDRNRVIEKAGAKETLIEKGRAISLSYHNRKRMKQQQTSYLLLGVFFLATLVL